MKSSAGRGRLLGGRMAEKSNGARMGFVICFCCVDYLSAGIFGWSWLNMSASLAKAILVSVPNLWNGDAGAGFRRTWVRSSAACMARSDDEVAGIVSWYGKNSTVSLCLVPFVLGMYTV